MGQRIDDSTHQRMDASTRLRGNASTKFYISSNLHKNVENRKLCEQIVRLFVCLYVRRPHSLVTQAPHLGHSGPAIWSLRPNDLVTRALRFDYLDPDESAKISLAKILSAEISLVKISSAKMS